MKSWTNHRWLLAASLTAGTSIGCTHNIKVEPIYMTLEIRIKVERELDQFFDFENRLRTPGEPPAAGGSGASTAPAETQPPGTEPSTNGFDAPEGGAQ